MDYKPGSVRPQVIADLQRLTRDLHRPIKNSTPEEAPMDSNHLRVLRARRSELKVMEIQLNRHIGQGASHIEYRRAGLDILERVQIRLEALDGEIETEKQRIVAEEAEQAAYDRGQEAKAAEGVCSLCGHTAVQHGKRACLQRDCSCAATRDVVAGITEIVRRRHVPEENVQEENVQDMAEKVFPIPAGASPKSTADIMQRRRGFHAGYGAGRTGR